MDFPTVHLLCLEQGEDTLEQHLEMFLNLAPLTTFLDDSLGLFLLTGLNTATRVQLSGEGLRGIFTNFLEWVLVSCGSSFIVDYVTSPTPNPMPSQTPTDGEMKQFEPTADGVNGL